jgi:hypothetical protein
VLLSTERCAVWHDISFKILIFPQHSSRSLNILPHPIKDNVHLAYRNGTPADLEASLEGSVTILKG